MPQEKLTQFDYLLNAMHQAGLQENPAGHGYGGKRKALYAYVRSLEARAAAPEVAQQEPVWAITDEIAEFLANDGHRNAAGGIYSSHVGDFARAVEQHVIEAQPVFMKRPTREAAAPPAQKVGAAQEAAAPSEFLSLCADLRDFLGHVIDMGKSDHQWDAVCLNAEALLARDPLKRIHPAPRQEPAAPTQTFEQWRNEHVNRTGHPAGVKDAWLAGRAAPQDDSKAPAAPDSDSRKFALMALCQVQSLQMHHNSRLDVEFAIGVLRAELAAAPIREAHAEPAAGFSFEQIDKWTMRATPAAAPMVAHDAASQGETRPATLAEQVADAQREVASWSPEKRANVQLQGPSQQAVEQTK